MEAAKDWRRGHRETRIKGPRAGLEDGELLASNVRLSHRASDAAANTPRLLRETIQSVFTTKRNGDCMTQVSTNPTRSGNQSAKYKRIPSFVCAQTHSTLEVGSASGEVGDTQVQGRVCLIFLHLVFSSLRKCYTLHF